MDSEIKRTVAKIPLLSIKAGPRDGDKWIERLKEEYTALITYLENNKQADNDWFTIESNPLGTRWTGKCWYIYEFRKYEFDFEFDTPITYPDTSPEIAIPELENRTEKMYRGGKICLTVHFKPLWAKNTPHFGIAHALALGLAPWLASEIPNLVDNKMIRHNEDK
ncbi:ubiquitin-like post-translational modifier [Cavenderia fasciculata]|uniref:Ubiquitin-fold modifier-conjugating enzyme 1 n=1 Tax=Cavenderia fasciculata TaxID=261658 RepID=F4Q4M2_CACFS|nr:ubiquitin-like post-translational modifier [Cavenderia fasciculata]EGG17031.1 ubiquitin-like post-translational modifier [Cavenderia fasciculata]|eukprot:XP_004355515.1 ubiquitin-like post-translational modifier [Cavenderia fasciculata]